MSLLSKMSVLKKVAMAGVGLFIYGSAVAAIEMLGILTPTVQALTGSGAEEMQTQQKVNWQSGTYGQLTPSNTVAIDDVRPFGSQLFDGGFRGLRADGLNSDYRIAPGDQVVLRIWGAIDGESAAR